jgi:hypothetical protein
MQARRGGTRRCSEPDVTLIHEYGQDGSVYHIDSNAWMKRGRWHARSKKSSTATLVLISGASAFRF